MKRRWPVIVWLAVATLGVALGVLPAVEAGQWVDHRWLALALAAMFIASDARYWKPVRSSTRSTPS